MLTASPKVALKPFKLFPLESLFLCCVCPPSMKIKDCGS